MGETTKIEWADASWSPWIGCTEVHAGCSNCYAREDNKRRKWTAVERDGKREGVWGKGAPRKLRAESGWADLRSWVRKAALANQRVTVFPSLCDPLDAEVYEHPERRTWFDRFMQAIRTTSPMREADTGIFRGPGLIYLLLTKRPERWATIPEDVRPLVWLIASVSDQDTANTLVPALLAARGFAGLGLSVEPQVGPIDLRPWLESQDVPAPELSWVICGGESGPRGSPRVRPFNIEWGRALRDQCRDAGVPWFFKQAGSTAVDGGVRLPLRDRKGGDISELPSDLAIREFPHGLR